MKIRLNKKFLDNRYSGMINLKTAPARIAYVPKGDRNLPEYVLTYNSLKEFPMNKDKSGLYDIPYEAIGKSALSLSSGEIWLKYKKATVILITKGMDNKFRKENKQTILDLEALCVEK
jgi:hypothetical protein